MPKMRQKKFDARSHWRTALSDTLTAMGLISKGSWAKI